MFAKLLVGIIVVFSIILHEIAHGYVALLCGDQTAKQRNRLTLNPISHIDPVGTILIPLIMLFTLGFAVGSAKPVPVNPYNFKRARLGVLLVSFAGPCTNILVAAFCSICLRFLPESYLATYVFTWGALINLFLAAFNLLPIPPLDGSKVLMSVVPRNIAQKLYKIEPYGFVIVVVLVFVGALRWVLLPMVSVLAWLVGLKGII